MESRAGTRLTLRVVDGMAENEKPLNFLPTACYALISLEHTASASGV